MGDGSKLATAITLVILGLIIAIWGAIFIWWYRKDQAVIQDWVARGAIGPVDTGRLTNSTWWWVLPAIQILIGIGMIIWGILAYVAGSSDVVDIAKAGIEKGRVLYTRREVDVINPTPVTVGVSRPSTY
jgi:hypothetical protein